MFGLTHVRLVGLLPNLRSIGILFIICKTFYLFSKTIIHYVIKTYKL